MNKPIVITIGIVIFLLALGSWGYLFLFGTPQDSDEFFADLGFELGQQPDTSVAIPPAAITPIDLIDTQSQPLRQLTIRPVAGYINLPNNIIRYVEQGTSHIYEIDLASGTETRLTNTTIPFVSEAIFNDTGTHVVLRTFAQNQQENILGTVGSSTENATLVTQVLPPQSDNFTFVDSNTLAYNRSSAAGTTGYRYDLVFDDLTTDFEIPLQSVRVTFLQDATYVYPSYTPELTGALYRVIGTDLNSVGTPLFGYSALVTEDWHTHSYTANNTVISEAVDRRNNQTYQIPVRVIPEKCDWGVLDTLWCAAPLETAEYTYQHDWYQGTVRANDALWEIDPATETATLLINPPTTVGRELDIMRLSYQARALTFINKNDRTLWHYDTTQN